MKKTFRKKNGPKKDRYTIVLEDIHDQFRSFGEGQDILTTEVQGLKKSVQNLETRFDGLETEVHNLSTKVDAIADDVSDIKTTLSQKVDREEFVQLERKVVKLEKLVLSKL